MATFYNQATLSYNGTSTASNITAGEIMDALSVTKTALSTIYRPGDSTTYVISIVNTSAAAFSGLTLSDNLGAYAFGGQTLTPLTYREGTLRYYSGGILQPTPVITAGPPLTVTGLTIPAGGNAILVYEAEANQSAPLDPEGTITNTATVSGESLGTPIQASETIAVSTTPVLSITKSLQPATVTENSQITYTFIIENTGNTEAGAGDLVSVTDTFTPILKSIAVQYNGVSWTSPEDYLYDTETGLFSTVPGRITVPAASAKADPETGRWTVTPGISVVKVSGRI